MKSLNERPMRTKSSRAWLALVALSIGCSSQGAFQRSPHYETVTKHVDVGGQMFLYADVDGDLSAGADYLDGLLARLGKRHPDLHLERVRAKHILEQLGMDQVLALGMSSTKDGNAFHNKTFLHYGNPRRGLVLLASAPPRERELPKQAPVDVDIAFESDLKIKSLVALIRAIVTDISGEASKELFAGLDEKIPGTSLSLRQLVEHLDTRLLGLLRVDYTRAFVWPGGGSKVTVPGVDLLLSVDDMAILFDALAGMVRSFPGVTQKINESLAWIEFDPAIPDAAWLRPVFAKDLKTGRLFVATSKAFIDEYLAGKTGTKKALADAPDFKRATTGFMAKSNAMSYMSGAFLEKLARFVRPLAEQDQDMKDGIDILLGLLPEPGIPFAAQQVSMQDGLYYASYATSSHKSTLATALVTGPVALAGAVAAISTAGIGRYLRASKAAAKVEAPFEEGLPSESDGNEAARPLASPREPDPEVTYRVEVDGLPTRGPADALVTIVQFSDYQCPFCRRVEPTMARILATYKGSVRLVWRDRPLAYHKRAKPAAMAARAAGAQGKYWQMHDKLLSGKPGVSALSDASLVQYARELRLDLARFQQAMASDALAKAVDADAALADDLGVRGAPAFFINGRYLSGAKPFEAFKTKIDEELGVARKLVARGTPKRKVYATIMRGARPSAAQAGKAADKPADGTVDE
jgi:protein-disulfide isomerase